jgi:hypothetical protein
MRLRLARVLALAAVAAVGAPLPLLAQTPTTGRVVGRIIDAGTTQGMTDVQIQVVGTTIGGISGVDGRYSIANVPAGTVTILVRRLGYSPKTITGIALEAGKTAEQNVAMETAAVALAATTVTAEKERGSVSEALDLQKNSNNIVNQITAEQIAKSPDSDAAQAVQRVSGVTVQDGKYIQVRGLGERYTAASLNGARIPSPEPERKVVPLDLFPSGLLQSVTTLKTFTPDQQGDFSGALVDIRTREFPAQTQWSYSFSSGVNNRVLGKDLLASPRAGGELFGLTSASRLIPRSLATTDFRGNVTQQQQNQIVRDMRNVWTPTTQTGLPSGSMGLSVGGNEVLGKRIGFLLSGNYSYAQEVRADEVFAVGNQGPNNTVAPLFQTRGQTGRQSVTWGALANFSTLVGLNTRLSFNNTFTKSADNDARQDQGFDENLADSVRRITLRYVSRGVISSQIAGEHQLGERNKVDWSATWGRTDREEPDRSDMVYLRERTASGGFYRQIPTLDGARRTYFDLDETNQVAKLDWQLNVGDLSSGNYLKFGGYYRTTDRTADAPIYSILNRFGPDIGRLPGEDIFSEENACDACTNFNVQPIGQAGSYTADDQTVAGYLMVDWGLGSRVRVIAGARAEQARITVNTSTQGGFTASSELDNTDVLPSFVVNTKLTGSQNLRFAVTRTLNRPEYRELSPVTFREVLGGVSVTGNAALQRTLIDNADLRWEWFPSPTEVLSFGVFYKRFTDPIERVEVATSGAAQAAYQNAPEATNYGVEIEARKQLGFLGAFGEQLTAFSNVTLMESEIQLDTTGTAALTNAVRPMVGQAPYVVNAGLTYTTTSGNTSATLLFNVVGERITAAGARPLPDIKEIPRNILDFSLRFPIVANWSGRLDAKNLLDARYRLKQGNLEREGYNVGRGLTLGVSWRN